MIIRIKNTDRQMSREDILKILEEACAFDGTHGAINLCPQCDGMDHYTYCEVHYPKMKAKLEALPWTKEIRNPRHPEQDELPQEDGEYLTMLDADEHAVWTNSFRDGHWVIYNNTHVKWWMPWKREGGRMTLGLFCHAINQIFKNKQ